MCFSGGLAAEEPGQRSARGPLRRHPHAEEEASEHTELHTSSAQERPLETAGLAGTHILRTGGGPGTSLKCGSEWVQLLADQIEEGYEGLKSPTLKCVDSLASIPLPPFDGNIHLLPPFESSCFVLVNSIGQFPPSSHFSTPLGPCDHWLHAHFSAKKWMLKVADWRWLNGMCP